MIKTININDEELSKIKNYFFTENSYESTTHPYEFKGQKEVIKLFKSHINLQNKIKKINLIKERAKDLDFLVTADFFVENNGKIIGYGMPYIKGKPIDFARGTDKKQNIMYLKQLSEKLKKLHELNIIAADFNHNHIIQPDGQIKLIDHDNFKIDNLDMDSKNEFVKNYISKTDSFDKKFDDYFLNLYTISVITNINTLSLLKRNSYTFDRWPKDNEICSIIKNTLDLDENYNEDLIVDKINDKKDFKKLRKRLF